MFNRIEAIKEYAHKHTEELSLDDLKELAYSETYQWLDSMDDDELKEVVSQYLEENDNG